MLKCYDMTYKQLIQLMVELSEEALNLEDWKWMDDKKYDKLQILNRKVRRMLCLEVNHKMQVRTKEKTALLIYRIKNEVGLEVITSATGLLDEDLDKVLMLGRILYNRDKY